jgi:hypothetical protein
VAAKKSVNTRAEVAGARKSAAQLPHERDETVGMTDGIPSAAMQQAHRDVSRGLRDTDRGPVADATYDKLKRTTP